MTTELIVWRDGIAFFVKRVTRGWHLWCIVGKKRYYDFGLFATRELAEKAAYKYVQE